MSFKSILVPLSGGSEDWRCLDAAYRVAHAHGAHVTGLFVEADPQTVMATMSATGFYFSDTYLAALEQANGERRIAPQKTFEAWRTAHEIPAADAMARPQDVTAELLVASKPTAYSDYALVADLVVCPIYPEGGEGETTMFADALFDAGRPVLAVPSEDALTELGAASAAIAWDGSREAARALASALPLLRRARELVILHVGPVRKGPALADVQTFLSRHLLDARVVEVPDRHDTAGALLDAARGQGARLLVLGGYSHSRAREFVFGGVTRDMLAHATIPLFFAH